MALSRGSGATRDILGPTGCCIAAWTGAAESQVPDGLRGVLSVVAGRMTGMTTPAAVIVDAAAYAQAVEDAVKASAAYYLGGTSVLDDDAYDRLVRGIAAWEADHADQVLPGSPIGKVAGGAVEGDVPHTVAMLSLDNVFSREEFTAWTASLARRIGHDVAQFSVEPKLDGLAIAARYTHGRRRDGRGGRLTRHRHDRRPAAGAGGFGHGRGARRSLDDHRPVRARQ